MKRSPHDGREPGRWGGVTAWLGFGALLLGVNALEAGGDPLTSLLAIRQMSREAASAGRPVEVEGTVTYYDPGWRCLFMQDRAEAIFVLTPTNELPIVPGDRIHVTGRTHKGSFNPILIEPVITRLSEGALPAARKARSADLLDGALDAQRIEVAGVVRRVFNRDGRVGMDLVTGGMRVLVWVPEADAAHWKHLIGGEVRVTGACGVLAGSERQIGLIQVFMPNWSSLVVERSAPTNPFDLPQTAIADLLTPSAPDAHPHLLHLAGRVLGMDGSQQLELQDASGQIDVHTEAPISLRPGQRVQVVGFRSLSSDAPRLEHAWLRSVAPSNLDMPGVASEADERSAVVREGERLVTARQVRSLSKAEAERRHPVTLRAVVTYYHADWNMMFVQDETAGIYIAVNDKFDVNAGQQVQIDGISGPGLFAPVVENPRIQLLGAGTLPRPVRRELTHLLTGREDSVWVEVHGIVRSVVEDDGHWHLDLAQPSGRVRTSIIRDWNQEAPMHLVDAAVRVTGACASVFNQRRQLLGIQVYVPDVSHVRIEEPAGDDPFAVASQSISSLLQFDPERASGHRTKVTGVVTHVGAGNEFFVQDATGGLRVARRSDAPVEAGDEVEVVGFPALGGYAPVLEDTIFRWVGERDRPEPVAITANQVLEGGFEERVFDNHWVKIQGSLVDISSSNGNLLFLLQDGLHLFQARFGVKAGAISGQPVRVGSLIELTGVCTVQVDQHRQPVAFQIHAGYPDAVTVLQAASWWTTQHTQRTIYAGGALAFACAGWVMTLRRRVRQQAQTIRERLERELALQRRDRTLTRHSVVGIWQVDPEGRTLFVNPAMRRLLQVDHETDYLGREADSFLPGLGALVRAGGTNSQDGGMGTPREAELITTNGQRRAVLVSVAPIVDEGGRVESWIGTAVDITGLKQVEAELQEAKETAESASRAKSQFLANMSHEIRTPMNGVIGMINLLLRSPLNREQQDFARTVRDSAELLLSLIDDILDFSKIEAGRLALDAVDFDLREVVESSVQVLSHRAGDVGLGFGSIIGQEVPLAVRGDPTRLRQVLLNLLSNAIKFTEQGEVLLQVHLESASASGFLLRFEVHDTGIGVAPEVQRALFRPFVQADGSTTRKYGGTGLGLAISRQLVRLFCGDIGVRSELGRGSVFWFTARLEPALEALGHGDRLPDCFAGKRALVVDDNEVNRRIVGHHLDSWSISWEAVATPELGLDRLRTDAESNPFDVVILDMQMPGMDGLMMASRIRAEPAIAATRILLLTSLGQDLDRAGLRSLSIQECLNKPFRQEDLRNSLQRALRTSAATAMRLSGLHDTTTWGGVPKPVAPAKSSLRILVAEDNAVNQKVALGQLSALGYSADLVEDGVRALELLARNPYDVILMDCQMPRMDGYEATRRIRELEQSGPEARRRGRTNIIAMTAHAMHGDREKCLAAGMDEYLSKPLLLEELAAVLEQVGARCKSYEPLADVIAVPEMSQRLNLVSMDRIRSLGTPTLLGEILDLYLAEGPDLMARMREAQRAGDRTALERVAHTLKGSSSNVGADRLSDLLREVENECREKEAVLDEALLAAVEAELESTMEALRGVRRVRA
jgi:PAS domain S-box-containing protein